jgi:aminoglycoside phosphotransferase family enzyme/predicted kinase
VDTSTLIELLKVPGAFAPTGKDAPIEIVQTHASVVFLVGNDVYKIKKPKSYGFLDYSTLERRKRFCEAEVELNLRLAPDVYRGVETIGWRDGQLCMGGREPIVDYAVHMRRLAEADNLRSRIAANQVHDIHVAAVAQKIAHFHRRCVPDSRAAKWSTFEYVCENHRDNIRALTNEVVPVVHPRVWQRLVAALENEIEAIAPLIAARAARNHACEGHGDLRSDHVYLEQRGAGAGAGEEVIIIDCVEFDERYRCGDPIADLAFLAMDLRSHGAWQAADLLISTYLDESGDAQGEKLLPFYCGYRAMVRAKVDSIRSHLSEVGESARVEAIESATKHLLLALGEVSKPHERPAIVLMAGCPASGKSSLAALLVGQHDFEWIRSDVIRKELVGLTADHSAQDEVFSGIYAPAHGERTYEECLQRTRALVASGRRVVVDATFVSQEQRLPFFALAHALGVRILMLTCSASRETSWARLQSRPKGPSDADIAVYEALRVRWEDVPDHLPGAVLNTDQSIEESYSQLCAALRAHGLL